jgi:kynurenine formamidase
MKIIDLSQPIENNMPVYLGDPEVQIKQIHNLDTQGWRLKQLSMGSHTGTHVDAFSHMVKDGKTVDIIPIEKFVGETWVITTDQLFPQKVSLAFKERNLTLKLLGKIQKAKPLFIAVGDKAELDIEHERKLLQSNILTITDLVNMDKLPIDKSFILYAVPLRIKDGDGSPVRAFAVI